eukprot:gene3302-3622_t
MLSLLLVCCLLISISTICRSYQRLPIVKARGLLRAHGARQPQGPAREEYKNPFTSALSTFLPSRPSQVTAESMENSLEDINWSKSKRRKSSPSALCRDLEKALLQSEWFVTGRVDPQFFSDNFEFSDPDVKVRGLREYAEGVRRVFDQKLSRAEVVAVEVQSPDRLLVTWRLSGRINLGPGLYIKPNLIYTDFYISDTGLIERQEDRFSLPRYDVLLSALLPFTIPFLAPPAPPVEELRSRRKGS